MLNVVTEIENDKCGKPGAWCDALSSKLEPEANVRRRGLVQVNVQNLGEPSRVAGVCYKERAQDRGLMFNYCPWCGQRILENPPPEGATY